MAKNPWPEQFRPKKAPGPAEVDLSRTADPLSAFNESMRVAVGMPAQQPPVMPQGESPGSVEISSEVDVSKGLSSVFPQSKELEELQQRLERRYRTAQRNTHRSGYRGNKGVHAQPGNRRRRMDSITESCLCLNCLLNRRPNLARLLPALSIGRKLIGRPGKNTDCLPSNPWVIFPVVERHRSDRLRPARLFFLAWSRNRRHPRLRRDLRPRLQHHPRPRLEPRLAARCLDRHLFNRHPFSRRLSSRPRPRKRTPLQLPRLPRLRLFRGQRMLARPPLFAISVRPSATPSGPLAAHWAALLAWRPGECSAPCWAAASWSRIRRCQDGLGPGGRGDRRDRGPHGRLRPGRLVRTRARRRGRRGNRRRRGW